MSLTPGTRLGPYEIVSALGAGGMGEVYRARDRKLDRDVAIKILPDTLAHDPERLARFEREAKTLAALNHPNIAHIHGFEDSTGVPALVMELVEGPTLADRIAKGPLPIDEALLIARQIAEALEEAHEQGIIHRDLKPANIKVRADGTVKVLDFGLAKAMEPIGAMSVSNSMSPTITTPAMTQSGIILGTAAYMSPEQARGQAVDKRTDIWAFGCVLYEMLTGRVGFAGPTVSDTIAAILAREPDWSRLPPSTSAAIRRVLRRCIEKDTRRRLRDIGDVRIELVDGADDPPHSLTPRLRGLPWALAAAAAIVTAAAVLGIEALRSRPASDQPVIRLDMTTPPTSDPMSLAISPDGRKIVFAASVDGRSLLWVRSLDSTTAQPLPGTDDAIFPFWSPDSRSLGFFAAGQLKRLDLENGSIQALAAASGGRGGAWNRDGAIVFQSLPGAAPLLRISAAGGQSVALPYLGRFPQFLPDGRHFLYYSPATLYASGLHGVNVGDLNGTDSRQLLDADGPAVYASTGHLLFVRQETLFAQAFDLSRFTLAGDASVVAKQVAVRQLLFAAPVATSPAGVIAYRSGAGGGLRQLVWVDRSGKELQHVGDPVATLNSPSMSPDGRRLAVHRAVNGNTDIWLIDLERGIPTRLTSNPWAESGPVWSPDGSRLAIQSTEHGRGDIYQMSAVSGAPEDLMLGDDQEKWATDWSSDGRFLLYNMRTLSSGRDIWVLPTEAGQKPFPAVRTDFDEEDAQFSTDGKWIAYQSNESGQFEVYVQSFPSPRHKLQLSTKGGAQPRWRRDGKELFYIALDGQLMAVPIRSASLEHGLDVGNPARLFPARVGGAVQTNSRQQYVVSPDGERFLVNTVTEDASAPITVLLNWSPAVKK